MTMTAAIGATSGPVASVVDSFLSRYGGAIGVGATGRVGAFAKSQASPQSNAPQSNVGQSNVGQGNVGGVKGGQGGAPRVSGPGTGSAGGPYLTPVFKFDTDAGQVVMTTRDPSTGTVLLQVPSAAAVRHYEDAIRRAEEDINAAGTTATGTAIIVKALFSAVI